MIRLCRTLFAAPLLCAFATTAVALPIPQPPNLPADSYILVAHDSGQILAASNPDKRHEPASITKIMTAYIVFDEIASGNISLDDKVTISEKAWRMGGSKMFIEVGKQISVKNLLHGMITSSGNDATVALAEYLAGSVTAFAEYMNQYAAKLGLEGSHFVNATGWPAPGHYMTARDIATLSIDLIDKFPKLYHLFFEQKKFTWNGIEQYNRNSLLWTEEGVDGIKTGHTKEAGYCLVTSAKRADMRLVSVVLGTASDNARKSASAALLNYGFRFFDTHKLFDADTAITRVRVWKGAEQMLPITAQGAVYVTAPRGRADDLTTTAKLPARIIAPVKKGKKLGTLQVRREGQVLNNIPLYAGKTIAAGGMLRSMIDEFWLLFQ
ncbi:MAG: D-alanyl-D-alanine carboxypeptidase [Salinisphaera sp.]|nr:D-alanyl-D-alanine carboxypeptidase [Salinisphaera sp.]